MLRNSEFLSILQNTAKTEHRYIGKSFLSFPLYSFIISLILLVVIISEFKYPGTIFGIGFLSHIISLFFIFPWISVSNFFNKCLPRTYLTEDAWLDLLGGTLQRKVSRFSVYK